MSDPRLPPAGSQGPIAPEDDPALQPQRPAVARGGIGAPWLTLGGAMLAGLAVLGWMASHLPRPPREVREAAAGDAYASVIMPPPAPSELGITEAAARNPPSSPIQIVTPPASAPIASSPPPPSQMVIQALPTAPASNGLDRRRVPALVIDLSNTPLSNKTGDTEGTNGKTALTSDEQFAARISTNKEPERARATMLRTQSTVVTEGSVIPAVLETALNSDLPGFTRAVVSRDVRSFDGTKVLIPRGSRVIGQYKSGLALGASRAFVIWTRILRPDGVSIQIGSPVTDDLGRAGLAGKVDRHFLERFSGAILTSVLSAGLTAAAGQPSTQVVVGSATSDTGGLASSAAAFAPQNISPTIKVAQGSAILIFVAKDLDFTSVEAAK